MYTFQYLCVSQMLGKALWLINIKFYDIIDMFHKYTRCSVKMVFLTVSQNSQESIYVGVSYLKSGRLLAD